MQIPPILGVQYWGYILTWWMVQWNWSKPIRPPPRKEMSHAYSVKQSEEICKTLNTLRLGNILSDVYLEHVKTLTHSVFMLGYRGKIVNAEFFSEKHRTTVAHFLNNGRWNSLNFEKALKRQVIDRIYEESRKSGAPIFCIVDDTIASHTAPSSQAMHPIEAAYRLIQSLPHRKFSISMPNAGILKYSSEAVSRNSPSTSASFAKNKALRGCGWFFHLSTFCAAQFPGVSVHSMFFVDSMCVNCIIFWCISPI